MPRHAGSGDLITGRGSSAGALRVTNAAYGIHNNMKSILLLLLLLSVLDISSAYALEPKYRIGVILPLAGRASSVGHAVRNGLLMAYDEFPNSKRDRISLYLEDDASESRNTVSAFQRLVGEKKIDVVITALSNSGNVVVPLSERRGVILLSLAFDRGISNGRSRAFSFWVDVNLLAQAAANEALKRGYHDIAIVSTEHEGNLSMVHAFKAAAGGRLNLAFSEEVQMTETDFRPMAVRLRSLGRFDAVAALLHPVHLGLFVKALRQNGISSPVFTLGNFEDLGVRKSADGYLSGEWYTAADYNSDFLLRYRRKFPSDSVYGAAYGHDVMWLLGSALDRNVGIQDLPEFLRSIQIPGVALKEVSYDGNNGYRFPIAVKVVGEDGVN